MWWCCFKYLHKIKGNFISEKAINYMGKNESFLHPWWRISSFINLTKRCYLAPFFKYVLFLSWRQSVWKFEKCILEVNLYKFKFNLLTNTDTHIHTQGHTYPLCCPPCYFSALITLILICAKGCVYWLDNYLSTKLIILTSMSDNLSYILIHIQDKY